MRRCARCEKTKPDDEFGWKLKAKSLRQPYCAPCNKEYHRGHYEANMADYKAKAKKYAVEVRRKNREALLAYLKANPCVVCGEDDPVILEFDHRVRASKRKGGVAKMFRDCSWANIAVEIAKCDVVCANCHRRRTVKQLGWWRSVLIQG